MNDRVLKEYVASVLVELSRDEEFIRTLKVNRIKAQDPNIERLADEWAATQKGLKPDELRIARRLVVDRFPDAHQRARGHEPTIKRALFAMLNAFFRGRKAK